MIVCRSEKILAPATKEKLSIFCQVELKHVISVHDVSNIYHVPLILLDQGMHGILKSLLNLGHMPAEPSFAAWKHIADTVDNFTAKVEIAIVGKYNGLSDSYLSVLKSLMHSGIHLNTEVAVKWIEAAHLEEATRVSDPELHASAWQSLRQVAGVVVPGGFGNRGVEGKILAAQYCRESRTPYLGVCLGMQVMVIEYARHVLHLADANSTEFNDQTTHPAVVFMPEINPDIMGGTMRLGSRPTTVAALSPSGSATLASRIYGTTAANAQVHERHRHRYEVNPELVPALEAKGLLFSGKDETGVRMEIAELPTDVHPFFIGAQFHPEFKSRPNRPSPLFFALVAVACGRGSELEKAGVIWQRDLRVGQQVQPKEATTPTSARDPPLDGSPTPYRKRSASQISVASSRSMESPARGLKLPEVSETDDSRIPKTVLSPMVPGRMASIAGWTDLPPAKAAAGSK